MSLADTRTAIATALSTVDDVQGFAYRPPAVSIGDGWPLLDTLTRADGFSFAATWRVRIALPPDVQAASDWIDDHWIALVEALNPVIYVDEIEPIGLTEENTGQAYLQITGRN